MSYKKKSNFIVFASIIILMFIIAFVIHNYIGNGTRQVRAARSFIKILYENELIDKTEKISDMEFKVMENQGNDGNSSYSVTTKDYGIDLDSNCNVIGFVNKNPVSDTVALQEGKAIDKAISCLEAIEEEDYRRSQVTVASNSSETDSPYYKVVFDKYKGAYPYYSDKIILNINKATGKLDGYSNNSLQKKPKKGLININEEEAGKIALYEFNKVNTNGKLEDNMYLAYCDNKDEELTELAYVITISGIDVTDKEVKMKYFISSEEGKLIGFVKDNVTTTSSN